ncbi:hypothetical protein TEA_008845 [Camellia sinensis var. sinensis]|uniref:Pep3/Vps18 beta-propeller domain-containing protein n=1 Tax=Camellia sinensis var. sinensis TaxID=542762 RepID=A0A4S4E275_CAMSN|nr:hypothetical protein TEA_008845 [Camellia sinensis var. sinensis]
MISELEILMTLGCIQHLTYIFLIISLIDIDLSTGRAGEQSIHRVFVDPGGSHCIATIVGGGGADIFYTHAKWIRPRVLSKLKGLVVNAVAWNRQQITEASTREVILGTDNGQLHEIAVDEKDKKEKHINFLFELKELPEAFMGLQVLPYISPLLMETASTSNGTKYYVMAVTPTRLYSFSGIGSLDVSLINELHFFIKQRRAVHFAWLSGAGIYHGGLNFGAQHSSPEGNENFVENKGLLDYSKLVDAAEVIKPNSLAVSEFHFLLLLGNKVEVVNRISEQIIEELQFDETPESMSRGVIGLCSDASAGLFYAFDQNSIFQVSVNDEGRDMWKVYLDLKEYAAALANCRDPFQRDQVYLAQAEAAFSAKDFLRAASFYAKIYYILSFEEITLKFICVNEQDALRTFLLRKLDNLSKDDKCQITMISTWATELYLDKTSSHMGVTKPVVAINLVIIVLKLYIYWSVFNMFIINYMTMKHGCGYRYDMGTLRRQILKKIRYGVRLRYGRVDELVYFASLKGQYEIVVHHYIQQGEAKKALEVLQKPAVPIDLQYKFAPDLIMLDAYETVESWMTTKNLNPRKLIPAMMRYSSEPHAKNETHEVIKYLEFCVHRLQNEDPGVHNLLLSLYAKQYTYGMRFIDIYGEKFENLWSEIKVKIYCCVDGNVYGLATTAGTTLAS